MRTTLHKRRLLTAAAIVMMVSSALVSFFLVAENERSLATLKSSGEKLDQSIRALWEDAGEKEHSADAAVMVLLLAHDATPEAMKLRQAYAERAGVPKERSSAMDILTSGQEARRQAVDTINDMYLQRLTLENAITAREANGRTIADIAFLLQLMGLVLVILTREMHGIG